MRILLEFACLSFFSFSTIAFSHDAGGMSGGGGGLIRDVNNPWFLENTTQVGYCIDLDSKFFKPDITYVRDMIHRALDYWKKEFSDALSPQISTKIPPIKLATQQFSEVSCDRDPDIRFQMGYLTSHQLHYFDDVKLYAGAAIREQYDSVHLKGKGFVYIAPDSGPTRYAGIDSEIEDFWRLGRGGLLFRTLVHELGHVFGIQHTPDADSIMAESFLEEIMHRQNYQYCANQLLLPDFFRFRGSLGSGTSGVSNRKGLSKETSEFFGLPFGNQGMWMKAKSSSEVEVVSSTAEGGPMLPVGVIELLPSESTRMTAGVEVYLSEGQRVFQVPTEWGIRRLPGPQIVSDIRPGIFRSRDGRIQRDVVMHMTPRGPEEAIGAVVDGKFIINIVH